MDKKNEILVEVEGLSKKFCKDLKTSLWYGVQDLFKGWKGSAENNVLRDKEFWALRDINFKLKRGECLGLIGHNGAGKSTLLKILNGLINPEEGKVTIKGKVGALIELGAGFNPILTGRENIYNNGAVLGFSRKEINGMIEEIISFAEVREFIDMPVQNYSSGMKVRLGFAVAAQMKPDVLLIDEVLAVGDLGFVLKCFKAINELLPNTAIIFVSHNMPIVSRVCNQIAVLNKGEDLYIGNDVSKGLDLYYREFSKTYTDVVFTDNTIKLDSFHLRSSDKITEIDQVQWGEDLNVEIVLSFKEKQSNLPIVNIILLDKEQRAVARTESASSNPKEILNNSYRIDIKIPAIQLSKGVYSIDVLLLNYYSRAPVLRINGISSFQLIHQLDIWEPFLLDSSLSITERKI